MSKWVAPLELFHHPRNLFVAGFVGSPSMNFMRGEIIETGAERTRVRLETGEEIIACNNTATGEYPANKGDKVTVGVRPQDAIEARAESQNLVTGSIRALERLGSESFIYLNQSAMDEPFILRVEDSRRREEGTEYCVEIPQESCYLFNAAGNAFPRTKAPHFD